MATKLLDGEKFDISGSIKCLNGIKRKLTCLFLQINGGIRLYNQRFVFIAHSFFPSETSHLMDKLQNSDKSLEK